MTSKPRAGSQRGLTVVEMLLALALLAFVLLGITPLFMASVKSNYSGNEYTSIHVLARDRLEQLMNLPFNDGQLSPGSHTVDLPDTLPNGALNPFRMNYVVLLFQVPPSVNVAAGQSFVPIPVTPGAPGQPVSYKRIDVTVTSGTGPIGIGSRVARVSGCLSNPFPQIPPATPTP